jgi:hypothetical protein
LAVWKVVSMAAEKVAVKAVWMADLMVSRKAA